MIQPSTLPDTLTRNREDERRRAMRALLARPLLGVSHPAFPLVRRHAAWLHEWLNGETGWMLQIEADFARLQKRPSDFADGTRGARSESGAAGVIFNRRRYTLLCLMLADLDRSPAQITLGRLGEGLMNAAVDPVFDGLGLEFRLDSRPERRDLVLAARLLMDFGVLSRVAGDEEAFVQRGPEGDVLYDINRRLLAALLVTSRGPSLVELDGPLPDLDARLAAIAEEFVPDTSEGHNRALRQRLTRRLLEDPVVYFTDLDADELAYLTNQRAAIVRRIESATGLVAEIRAEGIGMVDPHNELTDEQVPAEGTEGHATLLIAQHLAALGAAGSETLEGIAARMRTWRNHYGRYWRKSAREPGAEHELCRQALNRLTALKLVRFEGKRLRPLPALSRFAVDEPILSGPAAVRELL